MVDDCDSVDERIGAVSDGDALPAILQLPRRLCQVAGTYLPSPAVPSFVADILTNMRYSTGGF